MYRKSISLAKADVYAKGLNFLTCAKAFRQSLMQGKSTNSGATFYAFEYWFCHFLAVCL